MSDSYFQYGQTNPYDWEQKPAIPKRNLVTPFNASEGWQKASRLNKIIACMAPLVSIASIIPLAVPNMSIHALSFALLAVIFGVYSYDALHRILRPLEDPKDLERKLRHFFFCAWWSFITPVLSTFFYVSVMPDIIIDEDGGAYFFILLMVSYTFGSAILAALLLWSLISVVVRAAKR